jgi:hypothetical protein
MRVNKSISFSEFELLRDTNRLLTKKGLPIDFGITLSKKEIRDSKKNTCIFKVLNL